MMRNLGISELHCMDSPTTRKKQNGTNTKHKHKGHTVSGLECPWILIAREVKNPVAKKAT